MEGRRDFTNCPLGSDKCGFDIADDGSGKGVMRYCHNGDDCQAPLLGEIAMSGPGESGPDDTATTPGPVRGSALEEALKRVADGGSAATTAFEADPGLGFPGSPGSSPETPTGGQ